MHPTQPKVYAWLMVIWGQAGGVAVNARFESHAIGAPEAISDPQMFGFVTVCVPGSEYATQLVVSPVPQGVAVKSAMNTACVAVVPTTRLA
jgi:hypothetical protein